MRPFFAFLMPRRAGEPAHIVISRFLRVLEKLSAPGVAGGAYTGGAHPLIAREKP